MPFLLLLLTLIEIIFATPLDTVVVFDNLYSYIIMLNLFKINSLYPHHTGYVYNCTAVRVVHFADER